ncbi:MAG: sigma-70 family RNA polymerase sigma factor [Tepidisphaeraceae bacterium]
MSSLSGAQYEADLPPRSGDAGAGGPESRTTDDDLFRKAQAGDRGAYGQIAIRYQHRLFNAIVRMIGDREEARELTQETLVRGLSKIDGFRGESQPYTWLFRIAVNLSISRLRKVSRRRTFSLDAPSRGNGRPGYDDDQAAGLIERVRSRDQDAGPAEQAEHRERNEQVVAALGRLDAEYRAVLVMRDIEGFDYQQMADVLGLPLGTLKSRLFRARLALRDELKEYMR